MTPRLPREHLSTAALAKAEAPLPDDIRRLVEAIAVQLAREDHRAELRETIIQPARK